MGQTFATNQQDNVIFLLHLFSNNFLCSFQLYIFQEGNNLIHLQIFRFLFFWIKQKVSTMSMKYIYTRNIKNNKFYNKISIDIFFEIYSSVHCTCYKNWQNLDTEVRSHWQLIRAFILKGTISQIGWEKLVLEINHHPCRVLEMKKNEPRPTLRVL